MEGRTKHEQSPHQETHSRITNEGDYLEPVPNEAFLEKNKNPK